MLKHHYVICISLLHASRLSYITVIKVYIEFLYIVISLYTFIIINI